MDRDKNRRQRRVAHSVRGELSALILKEAKDPNLNWVNITDVEMAPDLKRARVYFSVLGTEDVGKVSRSLERAAPFFQAKIADRLKLRNTPVLRFFHDESSLRGARIGELAEETKADRETRLNRETERETLARMLVETDAVIVCSHAKPDGDAVGSMLAMTRILELMGKHPIAFCPDGIPPFLSFLPGAEKVEGKVPPGYKADMTIILDTASEGQLPKGLPAEEILGHLVVIDHHSRFDQYGDTVIRDYVSATGQLVYNLCRELVWPIDKDIAECLYVALITDTGSFRQSNSTEGAFQTAADLVALGVDAALIASRIYGSFPKQRQILLGAVASTLEFFDEDRIAMLQCDRETLERCGASLFHLEGFVNIGRDTEGVMVAVLLVESGEGVKASFRSTGMVDVAELASRLGGGGHANASGASLGEMSMEDAKRHVIEMAERLIGESSEVD